MSDREPSRWDMDKAAAAGILRDRALRRKYLGIFATVMLGMLALGLWGSTTG